MCQAVNIMKSLNAIGVIVAVTIIALAGIAIVAAADASLLVQSASAATDVTMTTNTTSVGGGEQEAASSTNTTTNNVSNAALGRLFSFGEGTEATVNPINETYIVVSYSGNRIIIPPNATGMTINSTETGNVTINIQPNGLSFDQGQAFIVTEDGAAEEGENATITFVLLSRTNPDGTGNSTSVTFFSTNSTGQLAFLDNMVAIGQTESSPEGARFREWEWKGGTLPFEIDGDGAPTTTGKQTTIASALE
jgi:hypothetical protein